MVRLEKHMESANANGAATAPVHVTRCPRSLTDDRLWNPDDVARFLTITRSMVHKLEQVGDLPSLRIGACVRFEPAAVRAFARDEFRGRPEGAPFA
jgi:hypothetical protein